MKVQQTIQSQYLAALKMLKEAILKCPPAVWDAAQDQDKFWFKAQHVLYWAHVDLRATSSDFVAWRGHRKPDARVPKSKQELLGYLAYLEHWIAEPGSPSDLVGSAGPRGHFENLGRVIASIRHIQQHTGELYERLGSRTNIVLHWTEHVKRKQR